MHNIEATFDSLGLAQLPPEILELVARQLPLKTQFTLRTCSKRLRDAVDRLPTKYSTLQQIVSKDVSSYFLDSLGQVLACGHNRHGQLGLGNISNGLVPTRIKAEFFQGQPIIQIVSHGGSSFFLSENGQVFACGNNVYGQLGLGDTANRLEPTLVEVFQGQPIIQIIGHGGSSFFLSQDGQVFASGNNGYGQLGLGDTANRLEPTRIEVFQGQPIIQIIGHGGSSFFLSKDGQVFASGNNGYGQLGLGNRDNRLEPTLVEVFQGQVITQIISDGDGYSSFFLSENGQVFACGNNVYGQLGLGDTANRLEPTRIEVFQGQPITQIISHSDSSFFLSENGQVFACGNNGYGQLGLGDTANRLEPTPTLVKAEVFQGQTITQIISDSSSSFFLSKNGQVFACGHNGYGQLGLGNRANRLEPIRIEVFQGQPIIQIVSHSGSSFFLSQDGQVLACGDNERGQLGLGKQKIHSVPRHAWPSKAVLDLEFERRVLIEQAQCLDSLNPAVEQQSQDGSRTIKPLCSVVTEILKAHSSELSLPRGLLKSLDAIKEACPTDSVLKNIALPMQAIEQSTIDGIRQTRVNPLLFTASMATRTALEAAKQQEQAGHARLAGSL